MEPDVREFTETLSNEMVSPGDKCYVGRGVVTVVGPPATITYRGATIGGVLKHAHVTIAVGNNVDILFVGSSMRIIGVV